MFDEAQQQQKKLLVILGIAAAGALIIPFLAIILVFSLFAWLGGGLTGVNTYLGSAQARPATWLGVVAAADRYGVVNTLVLADMELESGGKVSATNYNCAGGKAAGAVPCDIQFRGTPSAQLLSTDAGLQQINSGPAPGDAKWRRVFGTHSPYNPQLNVAEGVKELYWDTQGCQGYWEEGLSAYNTGSCVSAKGFAYAGQVAANMQAYDGTPEASAWATGNYVGAQRARCWAFFTCGPLQHYWRQPYPNAPTWIMVQGSYALPPDVNPPVKLLWAPPPPGCTGKGCRPLYVSVRSLSNPMMVWLGPHPGNGVPMQEDPKGAPIMPGQTAWAIKVAKPGTYVTTAEWKWQTCSGSPPTCVWHRRYATSSVTILPAKAG